MNLNSRSAAMGSLAMLLAMRRASSRVQRLDNSGIARIGMAVHIGQ
jgi:hypothetical protein